MTAARPPLATGRARRFWPDSNAPRLAPAPEDPCLERVCVDGSCQTAPKDCDDGDECTFDECVSGNCQHTPNNCDDGDLCTEDECVAGNCQHTPKDCDDGDPCTTDGCDPDTGECRHSAEPDGDADGVPDACDNCPDDYNPDPSDCDEDGKGDLCDCTTVALSTCVTWIAPETTFADSNWWPGENNDVLHRFAPIKATWDPAENEGSVFVKGIEVANPQGYLPPDIGAIAPNSEPDPAYCPADHQWVFYPFVERWWQLYPGTVKVVIGAMDNCGNELDEELRITVVTVFDFMSSAHRRCDGALITPTVTHYEYSYRFIRWKYSSVLNSTGGRFGPNDDRVTFTTDPAVYCGVWPVGCEAMACTSSLDDSCEFGAAWRTCGENVAASVVGHELRHTPCAFPNCSECAAYTWEDDHSSDTGIADPVSSSNKGCNDAYLEGVQQGVASYCD